MQSKKNRQLKELTQEQLGEVEAPIEEIFVFD